MLLKNKTKSNNGKSKSSIEKKRKEKKMNKIIHLHQRIF